MNKALYDEAAAIAEQLHTSFIAALLIIAIRESARSNTQLITLLNSVLESMNESGVN